MKIRTLRADEIECRVQQINDKGEAIMLLYKDARCDMKILDEVFGVDGWQREHQLINGNLFCTVKIWSDRLNQWISKQDVGTESMAEKEKGQSSDSFKRACFNIGIGRELYSSPKIKFDVKSDTYTNQKTGKMALSVWVKFSVKEIRYNEDREIIKLVIVDQDGKERFSHIEYSDNANETVPRKQVDKVELIGENQLKNMYVIAKGKNTDAIGKLLRDNGYGKFAEIERSKYNAICEAIEKLS